jgi:hypothetical protein
MIDDLAKCDHDFQLAVQSTAGPTGLTENVSAKRRRPIELLSIRSTALRMRRHANYSDQESHRMPARDQPRRSRRRAKSPPSSESDWLPWGLYDDKNVPELSDETIQEAAKQLNLADEAKTAELRNRLRKVVITYWTFRRDVVKPRPKWFREQVEPIKQATERLYQLIHDHPGGIGLTPLAQLTRLRMQRPFRGKPIDPATESIEQILKSFAKVCDECLKKKGSPGAKKQKHLHHTTRKIVELWQDFTGNPVGLSLDTEVGPSGTEFFYPGPRFVHFILKAIDPLVDLAQAATALREVLGTPRMGNSAQT